MRRRNFIGNAAASAAAMSFSAVPGVAASPKRPKGEAHNIGIRKEEKMATVAVVLSDRYAYDEALEKARIWIGQAASQGARYICFPEYYFDMDREADGSLSRGVKDDGPLVKELISLAKASHLAIVIGLTEKVKNRRFDLWDFYNTALFIDETGIRGRQRKVFLWVDAEWEDNRLIQGNEGKSYYPYPPVADERKRYLPGWSFESFAFGDLERVCGMICADGLMPPTWSHIIPQSPQIIFYPNGRTNLLKRWGPDLGYMARKYAVPVVASNSFSDSEAGIYDSDGKCVARLDQKVGIAVARVTLGRKQPYQPVELRHWEGAPLEMLNCLVKD